MNALRLSVLFLATGLLGPMGVAAQDQLPNLRAKPAFDLDIQRAGDGYNELRFSTSTWNAGAGPLELIAGGTSQGRQFVYQRIYASDGSYRDELAGEFEWHPDHDHFHFDDYARYTLQPVTGNSMRNSTKTSFCLLDTRQVDGSLPGSPDQPAYTQCGNFFQGMSVGWEDVYGSHLPGQSISLRNLKDGDYRLIIEADPKNRLLETDESDNVSCMLLNITQRNRRVSIVNPDSCEGSSGGGSPGAVSVAAISPAEVSVGETVNVVISGSGFHDGLAVSLDNGPAPKPEIYNAVVASDTEITATVTVRQRGKARGATQWNLYVGDAVLTSALTVQP